MERSENQSDIRRSVESDENQSDTQRSVVSNADRGSGEVLSSTSETQGKFFLNSNKTLLILRI